MTAARQQVLFLWHADSALDSGVVAWAFYDGTTAPGTPTPPVDVEAHPPYSSGLEALRDGWQLLQVSPLTASAPGAEYETSHLRHEFVFVRLVERPGE